MSPLSSAGSQSPHHHNFLRWSPNFALTFLNMVQFKLIVLSIFSAAAITPAFGLPGFTGPIYVQYKWAYSNHTQFLVSYSMMTLGWVVGRRYPTLLFRNVFYLGLVVMFNLTKSNWLKWLVIEDWVDCQWCQWLRDISLFIWQFLSMSKPLQVFFVVELLFEN